MEEQLAALEDRVRQTVELCLQLRVDNDKLRQDVARLVTENKRLADKVDGARTRLRGLLERIPE